MKMKKLALALAAGLVVPAFADITSGNVVGYNNQEVKSAMELVGTYFMSTSADSNDMKLSEVVPYVDADVADEASVDIQIWNGSAYVVYSWDGSEWMKGAESGSNDTVPAGTAYWVMPYSSVQGHVSLTVSGQLVDAGNAEMCAMPLESGRMQLVANPYPTAVALKDIKPVRVVDGTITVNNTVSPSIQYYDGSKYVKFIWLSGAWYDSKTLEDVSHTFPTGAGFWVEVQEAADQYLAYPNPLKK